MFKQLDPLQTWKRTMGKDRFLHRDNILVEMVRRKSGR